jgi:PAS domain S-box-containing protein
MAGAGLVRFSSDDRLEWANAEFVEMIGDEVEPGSRLLDLIRQIVYSGIFDDGIASRPESLATQLGVGVTLELHRDDGRWFGLSLGADGQGGHILTVSDLSQVRDRENTLRIALNHLSQGFSVFDGDLRVFAWNRPGVELLGLPGELVRKGRSLAGIFRYNAERGEYGPGDVETLVAERIALAGRREPHVFERKRPDGSILEVRGNPLPGGGFVTTYTDVTERRAAERALAGLAATLEQRVAQRTRELQEKQELLESAFDAMSDAVCSYDGEFRLALWNRQYVDLFGLPAGLAVVGRPFADVIRFLAERGDYGPGDVDAVVADRLDTARRREPAAWRQRRDNGMVLDIRHSPLPGGGFLRAYTDQSDRAQGEEAQRAVLEAISFPLVVTRPGDGMVVEGNRPAAAFFGFAQGDARGRVRGGEFYVDATDRERLLARLGEEGGQVDAFETRLRAAGGRVVPVLLSVRRFRFRGENAILTCITDISERTQKT